jgi:hypothetical protein
VPEVGDVDVACDPGQVKRDQRAEQMSAIDGAEPVGEQKVIDDAGPEASACGMPRRRLRRAA